MIQLQYIDDDNLQGDHNDKLSHLAEISQAKILTAETIDKETSTQESSKMINIHSLSSALKPTIHKGKYITIKVQRCGNEEKQGIGYLEDGTMVVINGGADFLGETIKAKVLSTTYSSSGKRMIFCNTATEIEEEEKSISQENLSPSLATMGSNSPKKYFAL